MTAIQQTALKYAIALMRERLDVEAPANVVLIREHVAALERLLRDGEDTLPILQPTRLDLGL